MTVDWADYAAVLFDLDGVVTPTAEVHMRAWSEMFNAFLPSEQSGQAPYTDADYFAHVDGKPRYDGVRDFLEPRGGDCPRAPRGRLRRRARQPQERRLQRGARARRRDGLPRLGARCSTTCASSASRWPSCRPRPTPLPCSRRPGSPTGSQTVVERTRSPRSAGCPASRRRTPSRTPPRCSARTAATSVVLEDAVSGVRAGRAGDFGLVVGVDRGAGEQALTDAGADLVVDDLAELVP